MFDDDDDVNDLEEEVLRESKSDNMRNKANSNSNNPNRNGNGNNNGNANNNDNVNNGNANANVNNDANGNKDNDVQQIFPPHNPHLSLTTRNPPYIPPEQPKAISNLDNALNNVLRQRRNTSSSPDDEYINIEIATKYKDTIHVEDENTIQYQGTIYHPKTDDNGRKYFKVRYTHGGEKAFEGKVYLVNTFNQFIGWVKPDDNQNQSYVHSQTTYTIWFSQCHYLIMSYGQLKVYSLRYSQSNGKELSPMFLSTYKGLKHIITHPDEFVFTQDLYNIIFASSCMYDVQHVSILWRPSKPWL